MNSSHYVDANHVTQSCNLTHLIYGGSPPPYFPCNVIATRPQSNHPPCKPSFAINNLSMSQSEACRDATCIMRCLGDLTHTAMMQAGAGGGGGLGKGNRSQLELSVCREGMAT